MGRESPGFALPWRTLWISWLKDLEPPSETVKLVEMLSGEQSFD